MQEPCTIRDTVSGMMMKRDECTADDKTGTGRRYTDGWGRWKGKQHKRIVGVVNIMCMVRRAAWLVASGMVMQASGVKVMGRVAQTMAIGAATGGTAHAGGDRGW